MLYEVITHLAGLAGEDPVVVARRGAQAGDDQLPNLQTRTRRALLREDLRADEGLRMQLRQVQAHAAPGRCVREVRRRGHSVEGATRAYGAHRPRHAGGAHLVVITSYSIHYTKLYDVPHALAPDLGLNDLYAALFAHHTSVFHALVLAAVAFVVLDRTEDLRAEKPVALRLERAVVYGLGLLDLAVRPRPYLLR